MHIVTAVTTTSEQGPLSQIVDLFCKRQADVLARGVSQPADWDPVAQLIDASQFKRVGAHLEEFDWEEYTAFLSDWGRGGTRFEFTQLHISEIGNAVFQEIEERHHRDGTMVRKNVMAVYRFNDERRIVHLDIYEQAIGRTFIWEGRR
jgi:limonene-1,2-epoxide hydrolase